MAPTFTSQSFRASVACVRSCFATLPITFWYRPRLTSDMVSSNAPNAFGAVLPQA